MNKEIVVYIADDHNIVRRGMARLVKTFDRVLEVQEAAHGKELIAKIQKREPHAVILDVEMPVMGGLDTTRYLSEHFPNVKILILTMHLESVFISRLMNSGAHGFLSKSSEPEEVEKALYAVIDNDFYRNTIVENAMAQNKITDGDEFVRLSPREIEILLLICQELSPGEISTRLQISEKTFFNHRTNILRKANARGNIGLLKFASAKGYIKF